MDITLEQALVGLRNADKAGDTEAASRFAQIVDHLKPLPGNAYVPTDVATHLQTHDVAPPKERGIVNTAIDKLTQAATLGGEKEWNQNLFEGEDPSKKTAWEYTKALGNKALESSMGFAPMGEIAETSAMVPALLEKVPGGLEAAAKTGETLGNVASTVGKYAGPAYEATKNFLSPFNFMASRTGVDPNTYRKIFQMGQESSPVFSKTLSAFRKGQKEELPEGFSIGDYNFAISQGVPHEVALLARHYRQDVEQGAWYLKNLYYNNNDKSMLDKMGLTAKEFAEQRAELLAKVGEMIKSPEIQNAKALGIRTGEIFPVGTKARQNLALSTAGYGGVGAALSHILFNSLAGAKALGIPLLMKSPKFNAEAALRAGQLTGLAKGLYKATPESMIDTAVLGNYDSNNPHSIFNKENKIFAPFVSKAKQKINERIPYDPNQDLYNELQAESIPTGDIDYSKYAKGGLLKKFEKGGKIDLEDTLASINQAKQNIADTYDTAKDIVSNPTPYINKIRQAPSFINDPANPISHYIQGDISGGLKSATDYLSEQDPTELAMGFAQPGGMGIVGSIESKAAKLAKPKFIPKEPPSKAPTLNELRDSVTNAIEKHNSLSLEDQIANSKEADKIIGSYLKDPKADLLTKNAKLLKSETGVKGGEPIKLEDGRGVETTGLSLFPAYEQEGFKMCPNSKSCKEACLGLTSGGNYRFGGSEDLNAKLGPRLANYNKTMAFLNDPEAFATKLHSEILSAKQDAEANGNMLGVRLNTLSDLHPKVFQSLMEAHPDVQFYDYTKLDTNPLAPNHHITYSSTGIHQKAGYNGLDHDIPNIHQNWSTMRRRLDNGDNVAMAFTHKDELPSRVFDEETGNFYKVVDGDSHDFRPLDKTLEGEKGVIVGLAKKADNMGHMDAADKSKGFLVHYDPKYKRVNDKPNGKLIRDKNGNPIKTNDEVVIPTQPSTKKIIPIGEQ